MVRNGTPHELRRQTRGSVDGHDLVVVAVDDERGHVELPEVLRVVRFGKNLDAVERPLEPGHHALQPEEIPQALRHLRAGTVGPVEGRAQVLEELRAVREHAGADLVERLPGQAEGIGSRLEHQRRDGGNEHGLGHARRAVSADVPGHLAAAGGVADVDGVLEIERLDEFRQIVGVGVHVVAPPGLAGAAVAAAIMRDAAVAARGQEEHLVVPGVRAQGPAVAEDDGLARAPVLEVNLCAVFGGEGTHECVAFLFWVLGKVMARATGRAGKGRGSIKGSVSPKSRGSAPRWPRRLPPGRSGRCRASGNRRS